MPMFGNYVAWSLESLYAAFMCYTFLKGFNHMAWYLSHVKTPVCVRVCRPSLNVLSASSHDIVYTDYNTNPHPYKNMPSLI